MTEQTQQKTILITGGCGFIGHHFVEHVVRKTNWNIIIIDKLNYASFGLERLKYLGYDKHPRVKIFTWDLCNLFSEGMIQEIGKVDYIVHMAAETHVDNSIDHPVEFINNNIKSTVSMLEFARIQKDLKIFFYFSTDEVFGSAPDGVAYKEWDTHHPTNPYSASKSASEMLCLGYENTYKIPLMIVNVMNAFGERQHVEKFIPKVIKKVLNGEKVYIHSYPDKQRAGSRFYIHGRNIAASVLFLINKGKLGEKYNVVGEKEVDNLEMSLTIAKIIGKPLNYEMVDFHSSRPGHDHRYALDGEKLKEMGWSLPVSFEESLKKTVEWTLQHEEWLDE
jgi:dTDP-glucose 4,6-dehydratase